MTSKYTKPTTIEYLMPKRWRERNNIDIPDEYIQLRQTSDAIVYGGFSFFVYILGLYIGSM